MSRIFSARQEYEALAYSQSMLRQAIPKHITPEWERDVFNHVMKQEYPGVTLRDQLGDSQTSGFMVGRPEYAESPDERVPFWMLTPQDISDYAGKHRDVINSDPDNAYGGWRGDDNMWYNDVPHNVKNPWKAMDEAEHGGEKAVWDLNQDKEVPTDEGQAQLHYKDQPGYYMAAMEPRWR